VLGYGIVKLGQSVRRRSKRMLADLSGLVSVLNETIGAVRLVKMFNMSDHEAGKFRNENARFVRSSYRALRVSKAPSR